MVEKHYDGIGVAAYDSVNGIDIAVTLDKGGKVSKSYPKWIQ